MRKIKRNLTVFLLLSLFTFSILQLIPISFEEPAIQRILDTDLRSTEGLFDGLEYHWNGTYGLLTNFQDWYGNLTITHEYADIFTTTEWDDYHDSTENRTVNGTSRRFGMSGHWDPNNHDWLFINVSVEIGAKVPIVVDHWHDYDYTVVASVIKYQSYLGRSFECWKLTGPWSSEAYYDKYTGILVNGSFRHSVGNYTILPYQTNAFQENLNTPNLTDASVTPLSGNLTTFFTYSVNYSDIDGNFPTIVNVVIDGVVHQMEKVDPYDKNYINGCIFEYSTLLDNSTHIYFFNASDLAYSTRYPSAGTISGPIINYTNNNSPIVLGTVTPTSGTNWTQYRFELNYSDADNNPPTYTNLTLNGTSVQLSKLDESDLNYMDGVIYYYETRLEGGSYEHFFTTSDGVNDVRDPIGSNYTSPTVLTVYWPLVDDVESGVKGWNVTGTPTATPTYGWHIINRTSTSPLHSWWCGDDITGKYGVSWNTSLESALLNLTGAHSANITFAQKYSTWIGNVYGYVEIRMNGSSAWTILGSYTGEQPEWNETTINITSYVGNYIFIRFRLYSSFFASEYPGWFLDDIRVEAEQDFYSPVLDQGTVTPPVGNTSTVYNYTVRYTDADNDPPSLILVQIDGDYYPMNKLNSNDSDFTDGCYYIHQTKLANTTHNYSFITNDGIFFANDPVAGNYSGPTVNYVNLIPPTLTNGRILPPSGILSTNFVFEVNYTDLENKAPSSISVTINGSVHALTKQNSSDNDYTDGCIYEYSSTLEEGMYLFHFNTSDGDFSGSDPQVGNYLGPWVANSLSNNVPYTGILNNTNGEDSFRFIISSADWAVVALRHVNGSNYDLTYQDFYNFSDMVANSTETGDEVEVIGINGHSYGATINHYAKARMISGVGSYTIEAEYSVPDYTVIGGPFVGTFSTNEIVEMCEMFLHTTFTPYRINLDVPAGLDLSIYVMNSTGNKANAIAHADNGGIGVDESVVVTLSSTAEFGIIFVNENNGTGSYSFTIGVDTTPPTVSIEAPLNQTYHTNTIPVNLSSPDSDLHTLWYRVRNASGWITGNLTWSMGANVTLSDGSYTLFAWANDTLGYVSTPENVSFTIDATAPTVTILSPLDQTYNNQQVWINLTSTAPDLDDIWYRIFNRSLNDWIDVVNITHIGPSQRSLTDGLYSLYAWANDTEGNIQLTASIVNFTINVPPIAIIESPLNITYNSQLIQINLSSPAVDLDELWYKIWNGTIWIINKTIWNPGATETLADGTYFLSAWANDTLGLEQLSPTNVTFTVDTTPPTALILAPTNDTHRSAQIWMNLTSNALDLHLLWYRLFNLTSMTWYDLGSIIWVAPNTRTLPDGEYVIYAWANDTTGNIQISPTMVYFTVGVPPNLIISSPLNITYTSRTILIDISCTSPDLDTIWYRIYDGQTWITENITWTGAIELNLDEGKYWAYIWANDTQGNEIGVVVSFTVQFGTTGGPDYLIIIIIIAVGAITTVAIVVRYKKSKRKTKANKSKAKKTDTTKSFAELVKPKD